MTFWWGEEYQRTMNHFMTTYHDQDQYRPDDHLRVSASRRDGRGDLLSCPPGGRESGGEKYEGAGTVVGLMLLLYVAWFASSTCGGMENG